MNATSALADYALATDLAHSTARGVLLEMTADRIVESTAVERLLVLLDAPELRGGAADLARLTAALVDQQRHVHWMNRTHVKRIAEAVELLCQAEVFDALTKWIDAALGSEPEGRLSGAWSSVRAALASLQAVRDEWVGADPERVAYGADLMVKYIGRILGCLALVQAADADAVLVDMARRYAYTFLKRSAPEAVSAAHVERTHAIIARAAAEIAA